MVARKADGRAQTSQRIVNELAQKTGKLASTGLASGQMGQGIAEAAQNSGQNGNAGCAFRALPERLHRGFYSPAKEPGRC